ncbi:MAG: hypothetical protein CMN05_09815, partial [Roseibacillus sp.]|nr:hypothetical protein [Roseibacillus sp.]
QGWQYFSCDVLHDFNLQICCMLVSGGAAVKLGELSIPVRRWFSGRGRENGEAKIALTVTDDSQVPGT